MRSLKDVKSEIESLKRSLKGKVLSIEDAGFFEATTLFNKAVKKQPQFVVLPENNQDITETINFARKWEIPLSVKSGGHDWAGRSVVAGGIQINMCRMNHVQINSTERTAVVQGGALSSDLIHAAGQHHLLAVTGTCDSVGYAGLTLGGGYGPLSSALGLAIDNVISAEIIINDGTVRTVDNKNCPDLFWALRGGGGNFGVITSFTIQLHAAKPLLAGNIIFKGSDATKVLESLDKVLADTPSQFAVDVVIVTGPDGNPVINLTPFWLGETISEGERFVETLKELADPLAVQVHETIYSDMIKEMNDNFHRSPETDYYHIQTQSIPSLDNATVSAIMHAINNPSSPLSIIYIHHFKGESAVVPANETAFPLRKPHYMVEIIARWKEDEKDTTQHTRWARTLSTALAPFAFSSGYANLIGPDEKDQIRQTFGNNVNQLQEIKKKYDPDYMFNGIGLLN